FSIVTFGSSRKKYAKPKLRIFNPVNYRGYSDPSLRFGILELMFYLLKTEPSAYSFADLQRDQATIWDGVTNPVALKHLRGMPKGAKLVLYHTGDERQTVGTATVESVDAGDPRNPK